MKLLSVVYICIRMRQLYIHEETYNTVEHVLTIFSIYNFLTCGMFERKTRYTTSALESTVKLTRVTI